MDARQRQSVPFGTDLFTIHDISLTFQTIVRTRHGITLQKFTVRTADGDRNPFLLQANEIGIFIDRDRLEPKLIKTIFTPIRDKAEGEVKDVSRNALIRRRDLWRNSQEKNGSRRARERSRPPCRTFEES
ncbi:hypothetical protein K0M31_014915 [Melipona bicolor]|uniref:Uncharacterized protein n=1 Tax=Melipona bicolor TaxID=60889 RepID=A0AA40FGQ6_9HYME|nr:hypothetical protein K0M31_014915 [Melipona bicolor]